MCSTGPFQFRWLREYIHSSCYYHHQIGSINLTHYHIFPWLCAWDACYIIFCHLLHIHSGKTGILFSLLLCSLWWVQIVGYVLSCRSCWLFVHYTISLSSLCKHIWDIELLKCLPDIFCHGLDSYAYCLLVISCFFCSSYRGGFCKPIFFNIAGTAFKWLRGSWVMTICSKPPQNITQCVSISIVVCCISYTVRCH